jgi:fucose permease
MTMADGTEAIRMEEQQRPQQVLRNRRGNASEESREPATGSYPHTAAKFRGLSRFKLMWIISAFAFANTGTEVAIGGWTSSYLRDYRGSGGEAEWIVSSFWGGVMVGRIVLIPVSRRIGEQRAIYIYLVAWLLLEVIVWVVPNLISTAVATALAGLVLGPCFPIVASLTTQFVRPRALHTAALGLVTCSAQSGSAFFPFVVGLLAQAKGVKVLQPYVVACLAAQIGVWVSSPDRR